MIMTMVQMIMMMMMLIDLLFGIFFSQFFNLTSFQPWWLVQIWISLIDMSVVQYLCSHPRDWASQQKLEGRCRLLTWLFYPQKKFPRMVILIHLNQEPPLGIPSWGAKIIDYDKVEWDNFTLFQINKLARLEAMLVRNSADPQYSQG